MAPKNVGRRLAVLAAVTACAPADPLELPDTSSSGQLTGASQETSVATSSSDAADVGLTSDGGETSGSSSSSSGGAEEIDCAPGFTQCDGTCADVFRDAVHCGGCDVSCAGSEICAVGHCAAPRYIHPDGDDANPGTSDLPWRTFAFAIAQLQPGDALLLQDGTYTAGTTGLINVDCRAESTACAGGPCASGTAADPITIVAEHERRALIQSDGSDSGLVQFNTCSYWNVDGLHTQGGDTYVGTSGVGDHVTARGESSHLTFRRLLLDKNNRYYNDHLMNLFGSSHVVEECEFYDYHRHGILNRYASDTTYRRNYFNSRNAQDIPGGYPSGGPGGDTGVTIYPGSGNLLENNVSENNLSHADIAAIDVSTGNRFLGEVSINDHSGVIFHQRGESPNTPPTDTLLADFIVVNPTIGAYARGSTNTRFVGVSIFLGPTSSGIVADMETGIDVGFSTFVENTLVAGDSTGYGIRFVNQASRGADYCNVTGAAIPYAPDDANSTNKNMDDPAMGDCLVRIPDTSPLKGAGKDGADIGGNAVYRYRDGSLTDEPLWDPQQNYRFSGCGAVVAGVNDDPATSCIGVAQRLHVGTADPAAMCPMPY